MISGQRIDAKRAKTLVSKKGAIVIDVRDPVSFRDQSIPGSINLPLRRISEVLRYPKTTKLIIVGEGLEDKNVKSATNYISQYGFQEVYNLEGVNGWNK